MTDSEIPSDQFGDSVYQGGDAVDDTDDLDPIESLSGDDPDEEMQTGYNPPDREPYNFRRIPTEFEERQGESLDDHLAEEVPDISADDDWSPADVEPRAGRLVAPDEGLEEDREKDLVGDDVGIDGAAASAEEAAVHIIPE
jgi:hypothetical protein